MALRSRSKFWIEQNLACTRGTTYKMVHISIYGTAFSIEILGRTKYSLYTWYQMWYHIQNVKNYTSSKTSLATARIDSVESRKNDPPIKSDPLRLQGSIARSQKCLERLRAKNDPGSKSIVSTKSINKITPCFHGLHENPQLISGAALSII